MEKPREFNIDTIFKDDNYLIPLYQRNYAWEETQVTQLIQDVWDYACFESNSNYYIGTLVVHSREINKMIHYETIDGQQRLTTINILLSVLKNEFNVSLNPGYESQLKFHSRPLSSETLKSLSDNPLTNSHRNSKMQQAYLDMKKKLKELFKTKKISKDDFVEYLLNKVIILRVEVPFDTDLNHYFEIMNNRGEQLEKHEILKAELLIHLKDEPEESNSFSMIWDACSNMEKYIQYGFRKDYRDAIFNEKNWDDLVIEDEGKLVAKDFWSGTALKLSDISHVASTLPFNEEDYDETQLDVNVARPHIEELLNYQSQQEFRDQRDLLEGEQQDEWVKFWKKQQKQVTTEVAIH